VGSDKQEYGRTRSGTFDIGGETTVSRLGYGAMQITGDGVLGEPDDAEEAKRVLRRAVELGVDFIDTADAYGPGVSERLIREALAPYDDVTVATKGGLMRRPDGEWLRNADPDYLKNACLCSLDRLGVDTVDLYQLHRVEEDVPLEDSLGALAELVDEGYVRHVGLSEVTVEEIERARDVVDIATVQNRYNVADRQHDDVVEYCEENGIGFMPWFRFNDGDLGSLPTHSPKSPRATTRRLTRSPSPGYSKGRLRFSLFRVLRRSDISKRTSPLRV